MSFVISSNIALDISDPCISIHVYGEEVDSMRHQLNNHDEVERVTVTDMIRRWGESSTAMLLRTLAQSRSFDFELIGFTGVKKFELVLEAEIECGEPQ
jgi:hypothetical protein